MMCIQDYKKSENKIN